MINKLFLFNGVDEALGRFESRDVVCRDGHGGLAGDIAGGLLSAMLDDETAETAHVNGVASNEGTLNYVCEFFDGSEYLSFLETSGFCHFVNNFCLSHNSINFSSVFLS